MINIKGLWLSNEILKDRRLTYFEKLFVSFVSLRSNNEPCKDTNQDIADIFGIGYSTVSETITSLKKKGYLKVEFGSKRTLELLVSLPSENPNPSEFPNPTENPKQPFGKVESLPSGFPNPYSLYTKTNNNNIQKGNSDENFEKFGFRDDEKLNYEPKKTSAVPAVKVVGGGNKKLKVGERNRTTGTTFLESEIGNLESFSNYVKNESQYPEASSKHYFNKIADWREKSTGKEPIRLNWKLVTNQFFRNDIDRYGKVTSEQQNGNSNNGYNNSRASHKIESAAAINAVDEYFARNYPK